MIEKIISARNKPINEYVADIAEILYNNDINAINISDFIFQKLENKNSNINNTIIIFHEYSKVHYLKIDNNFSEYNNVYYNIAGKNTLSAIKLYGYYTDTYNSLLKYSVSSLVAILAVSNGANIIQCGVKL